MKRGKFKNKKAFSAPQRVTTNKSPCGPLVIFICQMFEMLLDFLCHMSCTVRLTMCMQLRCNPKAMSYSGLWGERRMPRAETWWLVGVWEWVGKKESFQRLFLAVYMCDCTFMCTHMWSRVHLCVGRRNPSSRFLSWASSCVPSTPLHTILKAGVGGFGLYKIQPTRGHRGEKPVFLYLSLCVFPSSVSFHHSLNVTVNPSLHTHHIPTSLHPVCWCISYDLAEVNHAYVLASTGMCLLRVLAVFSA